MKTQQSILVIKHGAFGDLITATGAFKAIKRNHPDDSITLLTSPQFVALAQQMGYFDNILEDPRSNHIGDLYKIIRALRKQRFDRVYDLQNSKRTAFYFDVMAWGRTVLWSGIAPGCSHHQGRPDRELLPASQRFADQLRVAGLPIHINQELLPDVSWLTASITRYPIYNQRYCLLIPGSSRQGIVKRWPVESYIALAKKLLEHNILPIIIAGPDEYNTVQQITLAVPDVLNLCQQTTFAEIAALARHAVAAIGNDTGPTHLVAATGCKTLIPWSRYSDPHIYAPRGQHVRVIHENNLHDLNVDRVWQYI